jgi:propane monooxygenase small subunit
LAESLPGFDGSAHRKVWHDDPVWQPVRENVERITAVADWAEALVAANIVFESLVGVLFRSHLVMQIAARNGDYVTPTLVGTGENDYERDLRYTRALLKLLITDEKFGAGNVETLSGWLSRWVPLSLKAAHELQPIWSQPQEKVITFSESLDATVNGFRAVLSDLGLPEPKELTQ